MLFLFKLTLLKVKAHYNMLSLRGPSVRPSVCLSVIVLQLC